MRTTITIRLRSIHFIFVCKEPADVKGKSIKECLLPRKCVQKILKLFLKGLLLLRICRRMVSMLKVVNSIVNCGAVKGKSFAPGRGAPTPNITDES